MGSEKWKDAVLNDPVRRDIRLGRPWSVPIIRGARGFNWYNQFYDMVHIPMLTAGHDTD